MTAAVDGFVVYVEVEVVGELIEVLVLVVLGRHSIDSLDHALDS